jgi:tetratricopeptide (TPR) repeat protein
MNKKYGLIALAVLVVALVAMTPGCSLVNKLRAKNDLNEGVREFNRGRFDLAQQRFETALDLNPENIDARLFYSRTLNARFEQKQTEEAGLKAANSYESIIKQTKDGKAVDQALAFESRVFEQLATINPEKAEDYKNKQYELLLKRAELPSADEKTKAAVYYTIGRDYWQQAYNTSKQYMTVVGGTVQQKPIPSATVEKLKPLVTKAHEYLSKAISHEPDYADAWAINKLTYIQDKMIETNPAKKAQLDAKIAEADENAKKYYEQQKQAAAAPAAS